MQNKYFIVLTGAHWGKTYILIRVFTDEKMVEFVPEFYLKSLKNLYNEIVFDCLVYTSSE